MDNETIHQRVWNIAITNYEEYECHGLSKGDLQEILQEEWNKQFNGIFIGRDVNCVGRLGVFFCDNRAYVSYEDFDSGEWRCSYDLGVCQSPNWDDLVRLTPDDSQEYSFIRCSIIAKDRAWRIVQRYLALGELEDLYVSDAAGKPIVGE